MEKVRPYLDRLSTRQANLLRMRHGIQEPPEETVGEPPAGSSPELRRRVRSVEEGVLERARGKRRYCKPATVKQKIVSTLKKRP